jgi:hypothetical protein
MQEAEKTIMAIMFDCKQTNWVRWEAMFGAKGVTLGYYYNMLTASSNPELWKKIKIIQNQEPGLVANVDPIMVRIFAPCSKICNRQPCRLCGLIVEH